MAEKFKIIGVIICIITLLGLAFYSIDYIIYNKTNNSILFFKNEETSINDKHNWLVKEVVVSKEDFYKTEDLLAIIPRWEELTISQQFSVFEYNEIEYNVRNNEISNELIDRNIGNLVLTGYDTYTKITYTHNANCYKIKNFPEECLIAIQYEGTNMYYIAINAYYRPSTLGEFMQKLRLKEITSFGMIYYNDLNVDDKGNNKYEKIEFPNVDDEIIWQMLFDDEAVKNVHDDRTFYPEIIGISVDIPFLGYENISVSVSENGYLTTNIFETGKTFYIGEEKVRKFVNYIIENYDGYKTVYIDENGNEFSDNIIEDEPQQDDIIMFYDNTTNETRPYIIDSNTQSTQNFTEPYTPFN